MLAVEGLHKSPDLIAIPDVSPLELRQQDLTGFHIGDQLLDGGHDLLSCMVALTNWLLTFPLVLPSLPIWQRRT
jgi:hypothetical protein